MAPGNRDRLRLTFTEDAELYDRARPGYPEQLFADLAELGGAGPGCRVLEIGCGTGQATIPLARMGCWITAVEIGPGMAAVARDRLGGFGSVEVVTAAFEDWTLPTEPFDLVLSATAFHWIDPAVRVAKCADALRRGGALATVATHHVAGGSEQFFVDAQECYQRAWPSDPPGFRLPAAEDVPTDSEEIDRSGRFGPAAFRRYGWDQAYTTAEYLDVLRTYSNHRALGPGPLAALLGCIGNVIDTRYGGRIVKPYLTELRIARRAG